MDFEAEIKKDLAASRLKHRWTTSFLKDQWVNTIQSSVLCGAITGKGNKVEHHWACHYPITGYSNAEALYSAFGSRTSREVAERYLHWLLEDSPWSKTGVIPKDSYEYIRDQGFVWTDELRKIPANLLHNFLIATRMGMQFAPWIEDWDTLVSAGVDPTFAFAILTVFTCSQEYHVNTGSSIFTKKGDRIYFRSSDKGDWPLDMGRGTEEYLMNFLHGKIATDRAPFFPTARTTPINILWGPPVAKGGKSYIDILRDLYVTGDSKQETEKVYSFVKGQYEVHTKVCFSKEDVIRICLSEQERLLPNLKRIAA